jgi:molybdopterin-guanine dinucleotide biosynthesis protein A
VVVRAPGQPLPDLPAAVEVLDDPAEGLGPMQGVAVGLGRLDGRVPLAFVASTDLPFLHVAFVRRVLQAATDDVDVVVPIARGFPQPLAAAYRPSLAPTVAAMLAAGRLRPAFLFDEVPTRRLPDDELLADERLAAADPDLESVVNLNEPEDYRVARKASPPEVTVECLGVHASHGRRGPRTVRAATIGEAAAAVGLDLDRHLLAALNGDQTSRDAHLPLMAGDSVTFLSADAGG